jgi:hypothetical protein
MRTNPTITDPTIRSDLAKALQWTRRIWTVGDKRRRRMADYWRLEHRVSQLRKPRA